VLCLVQGLRSYLHVEKALTDGSRFATSCGQRVPQARWVTGNVSLFSERRVRELFAHLKGSVRHSAADLLLTLRKR
jgi:hypothetical protein